MSFWLTSPSVSPNKQFNTTKCCQYSCLLNDVETIVNLLYEVTIGEFQHWAEKEMLALLKFWRPFPSE